MTTWTTPTHVSSGEADSGKFNEETVDNLLHLRNVSPSRHSASGTGTAAFSAETTQATIVVPDQGCAGTLDLIGSVRVDRSNAADEFIVRIKDGSTVLGQAIISGGGDNQTATVIGEVAMTAGAGKTITLTVVRSSGSGTATTYTDNTANRLRGIFISSD